MTDIQLCRRCSITRVNLLCQLHEQANMLGDLQAKKTLEHLVHLAGQRGYGEGEQIMRNELPKQTVRSLCWNISSLLTDEDFKRLGLKVGKDQ
ncbi:hypothetical protein PITCH_A1100016 [uncultured Desulfobacterium sp.]|uniref:Uncharacterized protein n=1 Tax=uncultured Desulfobacterium sp. TaxID=201089 RepID=A0A445MR30_9BACT|nr:hypothetical protein PITCH_A1100016 [uncultured Desulfobacterium sp.]